MNGSLEAPDAPIESQESRPMLSFLRSDLTTRIGLGFLIGAFGLYMAQPADAKADFNQSVAAVVQSVI